MWEALHDEGAGLWKPSERVIMDSSLQTVAEAQGVHSRHAAEQR
jgi:hypothetical protein